MEGTIARLVRDRGFGFITLADDGTELFFHRSECVSTFDLLKEGQVVTFDTEQHPKGLRAKAVTAQTIAR